MEEVFKKEDFEILIATMNRDSLDFLQKMFPFDNFSDFNILIVNQTQDNHHLTSNYPKIRVINSSEKGLSKSRNLALENANGKIVLISDDDVVFQKNVRDIILNAYNNNPDAASIVFRAANLEGKLLKKYPQRLKTSLNQLQLYNIMSIEMTFNRSVIMDSGCRFDENFGLGSTFTMGEEAVLLHDLNKQKQQIIFCPQTIVLHPEITSNEKISLEKRYHLLGGVYTRNQAGFYFLWVLIKVFFDLKQLKIRLDQIGITLKEARKGRMEYLKMNK